MVVTDLMLFYSILPKLLSKKFKVDLIKMVEPMESNFISSFFHILLSVRVKGFFFFVRIWPGQINMNNYSSDTNLFASGGVRKQSIR
jgi:hypothetical protein